MQGSSELQCQDISKKYSSNGARALDRITLSLDLRGIFVLIGRNGSGKTTLTRILSTELEPTSGSASIDGLDVVGDADELRKRIAIVPQESRAIPWMTAYQTVYSYLLWRGMRRGEAKERTEQALEALHLIEVKNVLNRKLSGGMKRKVMVATVLASDADVIFLDEPTTGLDPVSRRELWDFLGRGGKDRFTFLTTHYLEEAERLGNIIGILDRGKLRGMGTLHELRALIPHNYSIVFPSAAFSISDIGASGSIVREHEMCHLLTSEEEAFRVSEMLLGRGIRFSVNPISLEDIFFQMVGGAADAESDV